MATRADEPLYHLEDFVPGHTFATPEREVSTDEIIAFAVQFDPQDFHVDPRAARGSVFGAHVGSGWHTAALTSRLWVDHGPRVAGGLVGLGVDELRWRALRGGDRIRVHGEILEVTPSRSGRPRGTVRVRLRTLNQHDDEVQHMICTILVPARGGGPGHPQR